jgi:chromate transporter
MEQGLPPSPVSVFLSFLRLGATAFGGPAMVAYIRELAVKQKGWLSGESFDNGVALCQTIPGATAMQTAAYVGLRAGGPLRALAAFVGFGLPAFFLMVVLSCVYQHTRELMPVVSAFRGLHLIVIALVANATLSFGRTAIKNWRDVVLAAAAAAFLVGRGSPIVALAVAAAIGLLLYRHAPPRSEMRADGSPTEAWHAMRLPAVLCLCIAGGLGALFLLNRGLFQLAALMLKVDLLAFGGGFASVPIMLHDVVGVRSWMDSKTFMDGIALGQVTPGPIVITATFVGYERAGGVGAVVATLAVFSPSFIMVIATAPWFNRLEGSLLFQRARQAVLISFVGLLLAVAIRFGLAVPWGVLSAIIAAAALAALRLGAPIAWVVLLGVAVSVVLS